MKYRSGFGRTSLFIAYNTGYPTIRATDEAFIVKKQLLKWLL